MTWRNFSRFLYALLFIFCIGLLFYGRTYYLAPARRVIAPIQAAGSFREFTKSIVL